MANSDSDANGNFSLVEEGPLRDSVGGNQIAASLNNSFHANTHDFAQGKLLKMSIIWNFEKCLGIPRVLEF